MKLTTLRTRLSFVSLAALAAVLPVVACNLQGSDEASSLPLSEGNPKVSEPEAGSPEGAAPLPIPAGEDVLGGAPLSTLQPALPAITHPKVPSAFFRSTSRPLPTNAFWENLVVEAGENRINAMPYQLRALASGLVAALPNPGVVTNANTAITPVGSDMILRTTTNFSKHQLVARDDLSATFEFEAAAGTMTAPIVQGMAYVTGRYAKLVPVLESVHAILSVNGQNAATGTRFEVAMNDGRTWLVYTSSPVTFTLAGKQLVGSAPLDGDVRVALASSPEAIALLDAHRASVVTGGVARAKIEGQSAIMDIEWKTSDGSAPLVFSLPHHLPRFVGAAVKSGVTVKTIRGDMVPVVGNRWTLRYDAPLYGFDAPRPVAANRRADVAAALAQDASFVPVAPDVYSGGKELAKLARLVTIAEELGDTTRAKAMRDRLAPLVSAWLDGTNSFPLVYDTTYGGIVSKRGLTDPGADYGQANYNDHHFHYGYHVFAAAIVAKGDPAWAASHREKVIALVRDFANPSSSDPFFPRLRHFDLFAGHSWANGLSDSGDGRNEESTSEAANAWYAVSLLGQALNEPRLRDLGRVLLAAECASAQTYWQIPKSSTVYAEPLASRRVVTNLWSTKADYDTWFARGAQFSFGIQMLPYTPATEGLLPATWIRDSWSEIQPAALVSTDDWKGFLFMSHAVIDKDAAWNEVQSLRAYDNGNSRTNTLHWIATRP